MLLRAAAALNTALLREPRAADAILEHSFRMAAAA
jgi:hypothetical protein